MKRNNAIAVVSVVIVLGLGVAIFFLSQSHLNLMGNDRITHNEFRSTT